MLNPQAKILNTRIKKANPSVFNFLSFKGKASFFPSSGIIAQSLEAKSADINATIGIGLDEKSVALHLPSIAKHIDLPPGDVYPYESSFGSRQLRALWQKKIYQQNPTLSKHPISMPIVTTGITHALSIAGFLFCNPGDEIIIHDFFWGNYRLIFEHVNSAVLKPYQTFSKNRFNVDALEQTLKKGKSDKALVFFNFPNNPTGYMPGKEEVNSIVLILKSQAENGRKIIALIDDAYFGLGYSSKVYKQSIFANLANAHENILAVKMDGATKEQFVWGFRVGFITFGCKRQSRALYEALENKTAGVVRGTASNVSRLSQTLIVKALQSPTYKKEKQTAFEMLRKRYEKVRRILNENEKYQKYFSRLPFNAGYFMCLKLEQGLNAESVRKKLLQKYKTGVIAMHDKYLRIAFSSVSLSKIDDLFENVYKACKDAI